MSAALIARYWHYLAGAGLVAALVLGIRWHGQQQYRAGAAAEQARWEQMQVKAARIVETRAHRQQAAVDKVDRQAAARVEIQTRVETRYVDRVREIYRDRDDPLCIDVDSMRIITDADRDRSAFASPTGVGVD